jgi:hypothetical protein
MPLEVVSEPDIDVGAVIIVQGEIHSSSRPTGDFSESAWIAFSVSLGSDSACSKIDSIVGRRE